MLLKNIKGRKFLLDVIYPQLGLTKKIGVGALLTSKNGGRDFGNQNVITMRLKKYLSLVLLLNLPYLCFSPQAFGQLLDVGTHDRIYTGSTRGFWFTAPTNFVITGIGVPVDAGSTNFDVSIIRLSSPPPRSQSATTSFDTLYLSRDNAGSNLNSVRISVRSGDIIGVLGGRRDVDNVRTASSYRASGTYVSNIFGQAVTLERLLMQATISSTDPATAGVRANAQDSLARISLLYAASGPDASNTQTMVYLNAFDVNAALTHRTMVIAESLSYDCSIFDANNICVSWGGRYGTSGNSVSDGAGVLTVAYRFLPEFYVGAFVDQSAPQDYGTSIRSTGMDPTFGGFLVWQENPDQSGFRVRLSAARHNGNVRITREASLSDTEAGSGKTGLHSWGYGADISYGFNVDEDVLLSPYAGIRRSTARRQGYTEETWDSVEYPLSYRHMDRELTTATMGIRGTMRIDHGIKLMASAGMEYD